MKVTWTGSHFTFMYTFIDMNHNHIFEKLKLKKWKGRSKQFQPLAWRNGKISLLKYFGKCHEMMKPFAIIQLSLKTKWFWSCVQNVENRIPIVIVQTIGFVKYDSGLEYHFVDYVRVQLCQEFQHAWLELGGNTLKI